MDDLVERLNEGRQHCGMCGANAVERNSRDQYICTACLHEEMPGYVFSMRWEAADRIKAQAAEIARLREALAWIARRDSPDSPPSRMLDPNYVAADQVRMLAHDVLACARAALQEHKE